MNETPKGKLHRLHSQFKQHGADNLTVDDIDWLFTNSFRLEKQVEFLNNELPIIRHRMQAQADQVYRNV